MKFKNTSNLDVYVDLGTLRRVAPGEVIDFPGALKVAGLSPVIDSVPVVPVEKKPNPKKKITKSTKNVSVNDTI